MEAEAPGSVTLGIDAFKAGDREAARLLWERYFARLVRLARRKLQDRRAAGADEDEEDAALSAFDSFCAGLERGRFAELRDRDDLWRLLVVITVRKTAAQAERRRAQKRGGGWTALAPAAHGSSADESDLPAALASTEPTPEFAATVAEEYHVLLESLGDDDLRRIAILKMEGHTSDEIAELLGCARRTVARRLDLIRKIWSEGEAA